MTDEIDMEQLKKELKDVIPDNTAEIEDLKKQIKTIAHNITHDTSKNQDKGSPGSLEKKHEHRTHSYDKICPDCGKDNPDYDKNQYTCANCGKDIGTKEEAEKSVACPHCGKNEGAESSKEGWTL